MTSPDTKTEHQPLLVLADPEPTITCHVVYNPLDLEQRSVGTIAWFREKTLIDYLDGLPDHVEWGVAVNGVAIPSDEWAETRLKINDHLVVVPIPEGGGGGGKPVLRLVAMIAVAVLAAQTGGAAAAAMGFVTETGALTTAGMVVSAVAGGVITAVGGMLVNALIPTPKSKAPEQGDFSTESPSYGIDGAKNTAVEDVVVPIVYGEFRVGGNVTAIQTENVDDAQFLKMMSVVSEGPVEYIGNFEINDQPAGNYQGVETVTRNGGSNQEFCDWFASTTRQINKGITLTHDVWATHVTEGEIDQLRVDLVFPQGLGYVKDDGGLEGRGVRVDVEYRLVGTETWNGMYPSSVWKEFSGPTPAGTTDIKLQVMPTLIETGDFYEHRDSTYAVRGWDVKVEYAGADGVWRTFGTDAGTESRWYWGGSTAADSKTFEINGLAPGVYQVRVTGGTLQGSWVLAPASAEIRAAQRKALRRTFMTPTLEEGIYEIRVKRNAPSADDGRTMDMVVWTDVGEIISERVAYNNTAYYGVKVRLSEQLNSLPKITALVRGVKVAHYDARGNHTVTKWSSNPAWVALDVLCNTRYGAALPLWRFDMPKWFEWADWCQKRGYEFNGVFDFKSNIWDAVQAILRVGHAQIVRVGTRYSLAIEKPETPTMMFGSGNIIEDTFTIDWLPMEDRANEIEVNYYDRTDGFGRKIVRVVDERALALGLPQKVASITLQGVTDYEQARFEGYFHMAMNRLIQQTVTFDAPLEAFACSVGDTILVQHDMPQWGYAGRLAPGSTNRVIKLDRPVTMEGGKSYKLFVLHSALKRGTATVQLVSTNSIMVSGMPAGRVTRIKAAGVDVGVAQTIQGTWNELILNDAPAGISAGMTVELWDTDVIEERPVSGSGETETITVGVSFSQAPDAYANWMFGEVTKVAKPFRVRSINGSGLDVRTISATEYNEDAYLDPENAGLPNNYSDLPVTIGHVAVDTVREEKLTPDGMVMRCWLSWKRPAFGVYAGADVYLSINGDPLTQFTTVTNGATTFSFDAGAGDVLGVRLVAIDVDGNKPPVDTAPVYEYTVVGVGVPPQAPSNLVAVGGIRSVALSWQNPVDPTVDHIEVWRSETPNREEAVKVADAWGSTFTNNSLRGMVDYWFWVRAANKMGLVSAWNSEMGTHARTEPLNAQDIGDAIIDRSHLIPELAERIDLIDTQAIYDRINDALSDIGMPDVEALSEALLESLTLGYERFEEIKAHRGITERRAAVVDVKVQELQTEDASLAERVTTVAAEFDNQLAIVNENLNAQATEDAALAQRITMLQATVEEDITAAINETQRVMAEADEALAAQITTIGARVDGAEAAIQDEQTARADADTALSQSINFLISRVGSAEATIQNEQATRANADSALSSSISTLQSTVNGHTTSIQTQASSIDGLRGQYTVKIDNNGYVSGFGLASYPVDSGIHSEFIIRADAFAVVHPGHTKVIPFGVYNGRVTMDAAYIREATIDTLHVRNGAVSIAGAATGGAMSLGLAEQNASVFWMTCATAPVFMLGNITARVGTWQQGDTTSGNQVYGRLMIDYSDVTGWVEMGHGSNAIAAKFDGLGDGARQFYIQVRGSDYGGWFGSGPGVQRTSLFCQQLKR